MKFSENLQKLRKEYGYSQEQLADELGVSRQAVSKWESNSSYPEMETLIAMTELFDTTMDELIQQEVSVEHKMKKKDYLAFFHKFALAMAIGVALVMLGVVSVLIMEAVMPKNSDLIAVPFFGFVLVAVIIFVYVGLERSEFDRELRETGIIDIDAPTRKKFMKKFNLAMVIGIALSILGLIMTLVTEHTCGSHSNLPAIVFFGFIIIAVFLFVYYGVIYDAYNQKSKLEKQVHKEKLSEKISGVIMLSATIIFLICGLIFNLWHPGRVAFPVGGILCAIVSVLLEDDEKR